MDAKETTNTELYPEPNPHFSQDWKKSMSTVLRIMKTEFYKKKKKTQGREYYLLASSWGASQFFFFFSFPILS